MLVDQKMFALRYYASQHAFCFTYERAYKQKKLKLARSMMLNLRRFINQWSCHINCQTGHRNHQKQSQRLQITKFFWGRMPPDPLVLACLHTLLHHTLTQKKLDHIQNASSTPGRLSSDGLMVGQTWRDEVGGHAITNSSIPYRRHRIPKWPHSLKLVFPFINYYRKVDTSNSYIYDNV